LLAELFAGSFVAGEELVRIYGRSNDRAADVLVVRKEQAQQRPGDRETLANLHDAALNDKNMVYARAIEHVIRSFDAGAGPLPPPPLAMQREEPSLVAALLFRSVSPPVLEALSLAMDTGLYRRDPVQYGLTGVERVQAGVATIIAEVYAAVVRLLGAG